MTTKCNILLTAIAVLSQLSLVQSTVEYFVGFKRLQILDGYTCPLNDTIKEETVKTKFLCLILCSRQTSCKGVFTSPDSSLSCVMCSTMFFSIQVALQTNSTRQFYKRIENSGNVGNTSEVSVFSTISSAVNWSKAEEKCISYGGHLAKIISEEETDHVFNVTLASQKYGVWLGGSGMSGLVNTFRWWDGTRLVDGYENWSPGQPWSTETGLICIALYMTAGGKWGDEPCSQRKASLCKFD